MYSKWKSFYFRSGRPTRRYSRLNEICEKVSGALQKIVLGIAMYIRRHATAMSSITRTWFELWLDHSGSMTSTDLCRHLAGSCPSFYLRPRYTMPKPFMHGRNRSRASRWIWIGFSFCTYRKQYVIYFLRVISQDCEGI